MKTDCVTNGNKTLILQMVIVYVYTMYTNEKLNYMSTVVLEFRSIL